MASVLATLEASDMAPYLGMKPFMTDEELQALCAAWQARLRLQDWRVKAEFARRPEMGDLSTTGRVLMRIEHKNARILVLDPLDMPTGGVFADDPEGVLVHELLHLHFAPFIVETGSPEDIAQEQAINCIRDALLSVARAGM
jgi:hypothetical protein